MESARQKASSTRDADPPRPRKKRDLLYDRCIAEKPVGEHFTLRELESFKIIEDAEELRQACQELMAHHLFILLKNSAYRTRKKEDAVKLLNLSQENLMLYTRIESAHTNGIWRRALVDLTRLHENVVTKGIKELISKSLVKEIKSAKHPAKRVYMLAHLEPSVENTGGNFFNDGEMDVGLVDTLGDWIVDLIKSRSWVEEAGPPIPKKDLKRKRGDRTSTAATEDASYINGRLQKIPRGPNGRPLVPQPPNYDGYLDAGPILQLIKDSGILRNSIELSRADIQQLLDQLEFDGAIQRMGTRSRAPTYRSVRRTWERVPDDNPDGASSSGTAINYFGPGSALTQTPCGVCPVFKSCKPGGMVSPETCVYMEEWLNF